MPTLNSTDVYKRILYYMLHKQTKTYRFLFPMYLYIIQALLLSISFPYCNYYWTWKGTQKLARAVWLGSTLNFECWMLNEYTTYVMISFTPTSFLLHAGKGNVRVFSVHPCNFIGLDWIVKILKYFNRLYYYQEYTESRKSNHPVQ